jgi:hypothetical protein
MGYIGSSMDCDNDTLQKDTTMKNNLCELCVTLSASLRESNVFHAERQRCAENAERD